MDKRQELYKKLQSYNAYELLDVFNDKDDSFLEYYEITREQFNSFFTNEIVLKYINNDTIDILIGVSTNIEKYLSDNFNKHLQDILKLNTSHSLKMNDDVLDLIKKEAITGVNKSIIITELSRAIIVKKYNLLKNFPLILSNCLLEALMIVKWEDEKTIDKVIGLIVEQSLQ